MATNNDANNRVFLYEVVIQPQMAALNQINGLFQRRGKFYLKVPYKRMNQEMQRITRLGGKIVNIMPVNALNELPIKQKIELPWWVEIITTQPRCLYYFGPFDSPEEAQINQGGYVEDLKEEGANGITIKIKQCQPPILTQELNGDV
ncbi:DUF1816 domain-containing protein [Crocosphaera sp. UHCC 0190]|uniref:DUF1816 domain-containing protein n=1 Tax=Crocosphaera sp. UHCC 0190 TaxID=3110246 RepID=UPI002B20A0C9|nr:DUF1816 domain-containing protein [Crocosphaera sp. UHCC 0190]MEA5509132.1 DUF1816 domain-containing protein [Crocosphaera sp. UHCC 0190]